MGSTSVAASKDCDMFVMKVNTNLTPIRSVACCAAVRLGAARSDEGVDFRNSKDRDRIAPQSRGCWATSSPEWTTKVWSMSRKPGEHGGEPGASDICATMASWGRKGQHGWPTREEEGMVRRRVLAVQDVEASEAKI